MTFYTRDPCLGNAAALPEWEHGVKQVEMAGALCSLARELGVDCRPVLARLASHGLDAALDVLAERCRFAVIRDVVGL